MKFAVLAFVLMAGCSVHEDFGCNTNKHNIPIDSCYFCQHNNRFWDVGCAAKQHMSYRRDCEFCLVKAEMWEENEAKTAAENRARWAHAFAQCGQHSGYEKRRRDPWRSAVDGFSRGMATGLGS